MGAKLKTFITASPVPGFSESLAIFLAGDLAPDEEGLEVAEVLGVEELSSRSELLPELEVSTDVGK